MAIDTPFTPFTPLTKVLKTVKPKAARQFLAARKTTAEARLRALNWRTRAVRRSMKRTRPMAKTTAQSLFPNKRVTFVVSGVSGP